MAKYNLFAGGRHILQDFDTEQDLPLWSQADFKAAGINEFGRDYVTWTELMERLHKRYDKNPSDLKVGDKLRIFLQPNHATLASLGMTFFSEATGFQFHLKTVRGLDLAAKKYESQFDENGEVSSESQSDVSDLNDLSNTANVARANFNFIFTGKPHSARVDAIELEIVALPTIGFPTRAANNPKSLGLRFVRRFDIDGMHV